MKPKVYLAAALAIVALGSFPFYARAQQISADGKKSDEIITKIHKIDMINQLLPVLMTTSQIKSLLVEIEKARVAEKAQYKKEADLLRKVEGIADKAIKEALDMRKVVPQDTMKEFAATTKAMTISRNAMATEQIEKVSKKVEEVLDAGQRKAAANSLVTSLYFPGKKPEEVSESTRLRTWVKYVLMDEQSYEILISLSRRTD